MLTALVRYQKTRIEVLNPAVSVEFNPDEGLLIHRNDTQSQHLGFSEKGDPNWRDVFVMNENGSTVARYTL